MSPALYSEEPTKKWFQELAGPAIFKKYDPNFVTRRLHYIQRNPLTNVSRDLPRHILVLARLGNLRRVRNSPSSHVVSTISREITLTNTLREFSNPYITDPDRTGTVQGCEATMTVRGLWGCLDPTTLSTLTGRKRRYTLFGREIKLAA